MLDNILDNPTVAWAIVATFLMFLEIAIFGATGIGLLFMGLGAYIVALSLYLGIITDDQILIQFSVFFFSTTFFTIIL